MKKLEQSKLEDLKSKFGDKIKEIVKDNFDRVYILLEGEDVKPIAEYIHKDMNFNHANFCMGTDLDNNIEVTWYVGNIEYSTIIVIKVMLGKDNPEVDSLTYLWNGMDWHERETFEMLGVIFMDHGDLRRLILPDSWEGFPLRNDYVYNKPSYRKPEDELMS